jgi:alkylhydroperoxidase family enzyme
LYADLLPKLAGTSPLSAREEAALDFAGRLATSHTEIDDRFMKRMREHFTDAEMVELGLITGAFIMLGRLHRAFGVAPMGPRSHAVLEKGYDQ